MSNQTKIMVFIPAYNCENQIERVLQQFTPEIASIFAEIVVIENRSVDGTLDAAQKGLSKITACKATLLQNDANYNLGGSHKVAFNYCLKHGYDYLIVLHGDDQGNIHDILPLLKSGEHRKNAALLGARFNRKSYLPGYSRFRIFGNIVFNLLISTATRTWVEDMGSGLNLYKKDFLQSQFYMGFPDDLTFNVYMLYYGIWAKIPFRFFPLTWSERDQVSNAKIFRQAFHILMLTGRYLVNADKLFAVDATREYTSRVIGLHDMSHREHQ